MTLKAPGMTVTLVQFCAVLVVLRPSSSAAGVHQHAVLPCAAPCMHAGMLADVNELVQGGSGCVGGQPA